MGEIDQRLAGIQVQQIELGASPKDDGPIPLHARAARRQGPAVPFVVIGPHHVIGFAAGGQTATVYERMIERCLAKGCVDLVAEMRRLAGIAAGRAPTGWPSPPPPPEALPQSVTVPPIGTPALSDPSLPVLTVVLAGIDSFNPCGCWSS